MPVASCNAQAECQSEPFGGRFYPLSTAINKDLQHRRRSVPRCTAGPTSCLPARRAVIRSAAWRR